MALTLCRFGHVATTAELLESAHGQDSIVDVYQASRDVVRVRRGRYACAHLTDDELDALGAGGLLDCVSLLRIHGYDVPQDGRLHVRMPLHSGRSSARSPGGLLVARHWTPMRMPPATRAQGESAVHARQPAPSRAQVALAEAFAQARQCLPAHDVERLDRSSWPKLTWLG